MPDAALRHVSSALSRLAPGGRLVAITGASFAPDNPAWSHAFVRLQERSRVVFSAAIDGAVYAKHGTTAETRLTVIDKIAADDPSAFPASPGAAPDVPTLLDWLGQCLPPRPPTTPSASARPALRPMAAHAPARPRSGAVASTPSAAPDAEELIYDMREHAEDAAARLNEAIYEPYRLQTIQISCAQPHPTTLVQSAAMRRLRHRGPALSPAPSAEDHIGRPSVRRSIESVIYAGEAHAQVLSGAWRVDETYDVVTAARDDAEDAIRFRRGWFLATAPALQRRQVAGVLLDNWCKGAAARSGCPNPTSCWKTHSAIGPRSAWSACW